MRRAACFAIAAATLLGAPMARAQGSDLPAAQGLFDEARRLVAKGQWTEACPKFLASFKLDPKPGTALNLARCYEQTGQIASAWARFLETESLARRAGQSERERYAQGRAAALEARLSRLAIRAGGAPAELEVVRDGVVLDAATLGAFVPVDPGQHRVEARAPGKRPWSKTVEIGADAARVVVEVPPLEDEVSVRMDEPVTPPAASPATPAAGDDATPAGPRVARRAVAPLVVAGFAVAGAGVVVGSITGGLAYAKASSVTAACKGLVCPKSIDGALSSGRALGDASTVAFVVVGVGLAAGVVGLVLRRWRPAESHAWIVPNARGVVVRF